MFISKEMFHFLRWKKFIYRYRPRRKQKRRPRITGPATDDEGDLDFNGALTTFIQSTQTAFMDPSLEVESDSAIDVVDAPQDGVGAPSADHDDKPAQAMYMVISSHDVMQLTVTSTAVQILSELSEVLETFIF